MRGRKEWIRLEAVVTSDIGPGAYLAVLGNGHRLVAVAGRGADKAPTRMRAGDRVEIEVSPADMSRGRITRLLSAPELGACHR